jgi:hypothetical protein
LSLFAAAAGVSVFVSLFVSVVDSAGFDDDEDDDEASVCPFLA